MLSRLAPAGRLGRWSGWGWGLGYAGGVACLVVVLVPFLLVDQTWLGLDQDSAEHVRIGFPLVAGWYLLFALPLFLFTPDQHGTGKGLRQAARDGVRLLMLTVPPASRNQGSAVRNQESE